MKCGPNAGHASKILGFYDTYTRLTLVRRYIADDDPRNGMSAEEVARRVSSCGKDEGFINAPWLALPWCLEGAEQLASAAERPRCFPRPARGALRRRGHGLVRRGWSASAARMNGDGGPWLGTAQPELTERVGPPSMLLSRI